MRQHLLASTSLLNGEAGKTQFDIEALVGTILLVGVLLSIALIAAGLAWFWVDTGHLQLGYSIARVNLFGFVQADIRKLALGDLSPRLLVNMGIATLMLTPYLRVLASMLYFLFVEHNWKYTLFTGFVFMVLTYSLFLR